MLEHPWKNLCAHLLLDNCLYFWNLCILLFKCVDHIAKWWTHRNHFPNVDFLAKQILGIPKFQIETKRTFCLLVFWQL
jgi:hypothetical protein